MPFFKFARKHSEESSPRRKPSEESSPRRSVGPSQNERAFQLQYHLGGKLGEGAFGVVHAATARASEAAVAVKTLRPSTKSQRDAMRSEAMAWRRLGAHKHLVALRDVFVEQASGEWTVRMVMERCGMSLHSAMPALRARGSATLSRVAREMLMGLEFVHSVGLVHRDVKPANYLLGGADGETVKLSDFGLATQLPTSGGLTSLAGSPAFMAPEVLGRRTYDQSADVWSLGVSVYQLVYGRLPYVAALGASVERAILSNSPAPRFEATSGAPAKGRLPESAHRFIKMLMDREPRRRCTAVDALRHSFVSGLSQRWLQRAQSLTLALKKTAESSSKLATC